MSGTVLIIGGGVAGLVAARTLAQEGFRVTVLEATAGTGGALHSNTLAGVAIDSGAEAYAVTRPETSRLVDELGLTPIVVTPRRSDARLLLPDDIYAMPHAMLGVPTDLASENVVAILGDTESSRARNLDSQVPTSIAPDITLGALVRARMGDAVADRILTPVVAGVHAANPDLVESEAVIPGLLRALSETGSLASAAAKLRSASGVPGAAIVGLRGGMTTLVRALEMDVIQRGVVIAVNSPVDNVSRTPESWTVNAGGQTFHADNLVLAVDAPTSAGLLDSLPEPRAALERIAVGDVAVVAMLLAAPELGDDPVGSGLLVAPNHPNVMAKALTHVTAKWGWVREAFGPDKHLVRLSYGRDGNVEESISNLAEIARADVSSIFSIEQPEVLDSSVTRWNSSLVFPRIGHRSAVADVHSAVAATPGLAVIGAGLAGNGLAGTIALARSVAEQLER